MELSELKNIIKDNTTGFILAVVDTTGSCSIHMRGVNLYDIAIASLRIQASAMDVARGKFPQEEETPVAPAPSLTEGQLLP
jgi:hypothetical protein